MSELVDANIGLFVCAWLLVICFIAKDILTLEKRGDDEK